MWQGWRLLCWRCSSRKRPVTTLRPICLSVWLADTKDSTRAIERFDAVSEDRLSGVDPERLDGIALIVRAIEMTITEVEARDDVGSRGQLATLESMHERWREKAAAEAEGAAMSVGLNGGELRA